VVEEVSVVEVEEVHLLDLVDDLRKSLPATEVRRNVLHLPPKIERVVVNNRYRYVICFIECDIVDGSIGHSGIIRLQNF
jgi:hypothetical protein